MTDLPESKLQEYDAGSQQVAAHGTTTDAGAKGLGSSTTHWQGFTLQT
jgi:hypothetical protein